MGKHRNTYECPIVCWGQRLTPNLELQHMDVIAQNIEEKKCNVSIDTFKSIT